MSEKELKKIFLKFYQKLVFLELTEDNLFALFNEVYKEAKKTELLPEQARKKLFDEYYKTLYKPIYDTDND